jgi:hypothetical protein
MEDGGYSKSIKAVKTAEESWTNFVIEIPYLFYLFFSQLDSTLSCKYQGFVYPGYRILFSIRNPYINHFTNHFSIHS